MTHVSVRSSDFSVPLEGSLRCASSNLQIDSTAYSSDHIELKLSRMILVIRSHTLSVTHFGISAYEALWKRAI